MQNFSAHHLRFVTEVQSNIELNEHQGSALRGAFFHALRNKFCAFARDPKAACSECALMATCPVASLVSTLAPGHPRGQDRPRPYTIQPPVFADGRLPPGENSSSPFSGHMCTYDDGRIFFRYEPREVLSFGLTLYADAMELFPYVVLATQNFEAGGLGRKTRQSDGRWRRGTLTVREVWAENALTAERQQVIRKGARQVQVPNVPVTHAQIAQKAAEYDESSLVEIRFITPTRLINKGHLLKPHSFQFRPFFQRLLERLEALSEACSSTPLEVDFPALLHLADAAQVIDNRLSWEEVRSYSTRRHADSPTSGLMGSVYLQAQDWEPFLPWLLWGQFVHVGKDAVKGNGMYRIIDSTHAGTRQRKTA